MSGWTIDSKKNEQVDPLLAVVVESDAHAASTIRRPSTLTERVEMEAIHEVDSSAYPIAAGSQACVKSRSQICAGFDGESGACMHR